MQAFTTVIINATKFASLAAYAVYFTGFLAVKTTLFASRPNTWNAVSQSSMGAQVTSPCVATNSDNPGCV